MDITQELAHEIQAPLTALELRLVKLRDTLPDGDLAADCLREIEALKHLVTSFLELDPPELAPSSGSLQPVFDTMANRFGPIAGARGVELQFDCGTPSATFDVRATERILTNLIDNAIKFSPDGGVVNVRARAGDGSVTLEVRDEGIGISSEAHLRVFEPFFRVDREAPGSGLGLAISKRLAEAQNGSLHCVSEIGRGSSFVLTLPRS